MPILPTNQKKRGKWNQLNVLYVEEPTKIGNFSFFLFFFMFANSQSMWWKNHAEKCILPVKKLTKPVNLPECWVAIPYIPYDEPAISVEDQPEEDNFLSILEKLDIAHTTSEECSVELSEEAKYVMESKLDHNLLQKII